MPPMIGQPAPNFTAIATLPGGYVKQDFELDDHIKSHPAILFFYSMDFSYLCPTELITLNAMMPEFGKRKCNVVAVSTDSYLSHQRWAALSPDQGGIGAVNFPMVADANREIAKAFGVLVNGCVALRASFIIDRNGILRHAGINDFPLGRNIDELLRLVDALQHHERTGEICPVGWQRGEPALEPNQQSLDEWVKRNAA
jgi:peroxiredoxin 2/4